MRNNWKQRAETAEMAAFRLQATIAFLVKDVRAYVARERVQMPRSEKLLELEQSAGTAEAKLREDEPWRPVVMQIALLKERIEELTDSNRRWAGQIHADRNMQESYRRSSVRHRRFRIHRLLACSRFDVAAILRSSVNRPRGRMAATFRSHSPLCLLRGHSGLCGVRGRIAHLQRLAAGVVAEMMCRRAGDLNEVARSLLALTLTPYAHRCYTLRTAALNTAAAPIPK